jgi:hypothetical protein
MTIEQNNQHNLLMADCPSRVVIRSAVQCQPEGDELRGTSLMCQSAVVSLWLWTKLHDGRLLLTIRWEGRPCHSPGPPRQLSVTETAW